MFITGGSRGIGFSCYEFFKDKYKVITASRSGGDFVGDIANEEFRKQLIEEIIPDVFINNAGISGIAQKSQILQVNFIAAAELALAFSTKMKSGHIINLLSAGAKHTHPRISDAEILYYTSKGALECFSNSLQGRHTAHLKITNLELGYVMTSLGNIEARFNKQLDVFEKTDLQPMSTEYIAQTIDWILAQPPEINIANLKITNSYALKPLKF